MNIFTQIKVLAVALIVLLLLIFGGSIYFALKDAERTKANNEAFLTSIENIRTELKNNSSKVAQIELTNREIKQALPELKGNMAALGLSFTDLKEYTRINTQTVLNTKTLLRDSLIHDTLQVKISSYKDTWNKIDQIIYKDSITNKIVIKDTTDNYLTHSRRYSFLGLRFGKMKFELTSKNRNPYATITHNLLIVKK